MSDAAMTGTLTGKTHVLPVRVYYEDTDAGGIVYHANYLRFAERGRTEMLRTIGIHQRELHEAEGLAFAVYKGDVHYLKPARLDDVLSVETSLLELSGASVHVRQVIKRRAGGTEEDLVRFNAQVVCMNADGKAARLPASLRKTLEPYVVSSARSG
ncbi:MAG: tol-pal system-associated acyl-CoA thioesterase [Rhodospirillaceae bacterium]|nr:tol-pal system-associated acyl-CoA thioesterase [Rhodospirillaceae bacterium]